MATRALDNDQRLIGRVIGGKLRISELLGTGSMGRVYRAHHLALEKDVAIKVLRESSVPDPTRSRRFAREARAASRLNHPNSVGILDFGEDGDDKLLYIAMELLDGEDLQEIVDRGSLFGIDRICHIMIQVLAALAAAHDAGIIHRDMKPSNIVLVKQMNDEGQMAEVVKVCDFGVAKIESGARDTLDGSSKGPQRVVGTPLYMSPEQAVGDPLDARTDVYSCGVIMFEMLTGQPPFSAETPMGVLMKHVSETLRKPSLLVPGVPVELEAVILWALEKDRTRRPSSARELRNALRAFLAGRAGTIPALERYGVAMTPDESPWEGPTPYWQLQLPAPPRTNESPILPPPVLPEPLAPVGLDLVSDLDLMMEPETPPTTQELVIELEGPTRSPSGADAAPPTGAQVPLDLRATPTSDAPSPWEERSEPFSERSFIQARRPVRAPTPASSELDAPPPRSLSTALEETAPPMASAPRDEMAGYLQARFGLGPVRGSPSDGFWVKDAEEHELGPLTWSDLTTVLRAEASREHAADVSVSSDRRSWITAERFVQLTGIEAILRPGRLPVGRSEVSGYLDETSVAAVFNETARATRSGRLVFSLEPLGKGAAFEIHLAKGRPTFVGTNEPRLQLPNLLITKGIIREDRLPGYMRKVMAEATPLEEAVSRELNLDVTQYRSAIMKERLRTLVVAGRGRYALDTSAEPASQSAFAPTLLSLLPDLVYKAFSDEALEQELAAVMNRPLRRAPDAFDRLPNLGLTRSQRSVAERIAAAHRLSAVLPANGRVRKAYTTMAYVLRELSFISF